MSPLRLPRTSALAGATQVTSTVLSPLAGAARGVRRSMGAGRRALRESGIVSPRYADGAFHNSLPMGVVDAADSSPLLLDWLRRDDRGRPAGTVPLVVPDLPTQAGPLAATWLGHATVLLELDGHWVLTDPVWSDRVSPSATVGPKRSHPVPLALADLPALDAVLISHDHYDHLDTATIDALVRDQRAPLVVPLGVGAHLRGWGVPEDRIVELDWDGSCEVAGLRLTCTEARHFSGRGLRRNDTLWASWVLAGPEHRVFFGGDTGYTPAFADLGAEHGPFDLTLLPIGAYDRRWPDVHLDPAEAVRVHRDVGGSPTGPKKAGPGTGAGTGAVLLPIHWATFDLAFHAWADPVEWLLREAAEHDVTVATPRPGERVDPAAPLPTRDWWSAVSARTPGGRQDRHAADGVSQAT